MTFAAPIWLAFAAVLVLLSVSLLALGWRKRNTLLAQFAAARLLDTLTEKASLQRRLLKAGLIVASVGALALALARPQYGVDLLERKARGLDIVFVLDSSRSMLATDLRPNRLERAKLAMLDLIDRLLSRLARTGATGRAPVEILPGEADLLTRLAPDMRAGRAWADLSADLTSRARRGKSVNLDPAALLLDMCLRIGATAERLPL